jgi:hypothetical protein
MTAPTPEPEPPPRGIEYPPLENVPPAADPYAPVDYPEPPQYPPPYPPGYGDGLPPPVYPSPYPPGAYPPPYPGQFAGGYRPYDPYRPVVPSGTNGKAIAALVTSVIGLPACMCFLPSLIGIILGVIAMTETKRTGQAGYGLALAGVIVGAVTLIFGFGFMVTSSGSS